MGLDLAPLWTVLLGLAVFYYVVFDGFDLGVGMLYGFVPNAGSRSTAMNLFSDSGDAPGSGLPRRRFRIPVQAAGLAPVLGWGLLRRIDAGDFAQGVVLGVFIQGFKVDGRQFSGGSFDWVSPFPLAVGLALMFGYCLLGGGWLILKTEGDLQHWARRAGRVCLVAVMVAIVAVSIWTPLTHPISHGDGLLGPISVFSRRCRSRPR